MKKITALFLVLLLVLSMLVSCGAANDATGNSAPTPPSKGESTQGGGTNNSETSKVDGEDYERKIIKTYDLSLEAKDYETVRDAIVSAAEAMGGYVSASSEKDTVNHQGKKDRFASFTVRVPSEKVDTYVSEISEKASVLSKKLSTDDITTSYYDLQSQLESLVDQEARILKLMDEATNYTYLMQLDDKLTSIRAQINNINKQIQVYDKSVALSFVHITLDEVVEYTEIVEKDPSFGQRIASTFVDTFKDFGDFCGEFFLFIVRMLPLILVAAVIVPIILFLTHRFDKKKRAQYEAEKKAKEEKNGENK